MVFGSLYGRIPQRRLMMYNAKYPQFLATARDTDALIKTIGEGICQGCGQMTHWAELDLRRVCSEECREGPTSIEVTE